MKLKYRNGRLIDQPNGQDKFLQMVYGRALGRALLRPLVAPAVSRFAGWMLSTRASRVLIGPFIRKNQIDMSQFEPVKHASYNEFFSRKIREGMRPIDADPRHLIAPADSKLTALPITKDLRFTLKHTQYSVESLLKNADLAEKYRDGYALIFRLTVDDYHRYCYPADGEKSENTFIPGVLHTVNPVANDYYPIYKENAREYTILSNDVFGDMLMMEVGALLVGKIVNHHGACRVQRGQEKGYFQFGGSTVVMLLEKDATVIDQDILENSAQHIETIVRMGETIGKAGE